MKRHSGPYWTCPHCGANLDPGERCDCAKESPLRCNATGRGKCIYEHDTTQTGLMQVQDYRLEQFWTAFYAL